MKSENAGNAPNTDTMSTNEPKKPNDPSESDYLARQAKEAREAISRTLDEMKHHLLQGSDPRLWAKDYPWATLGAAAVAGFVAAAGLIPSQEDQAMKKLAELERTLLPPSDCEAVDGREGRAPLDRQSKGISGSGLVKHLMTAAKPAVMSALTAAVSQAMHQMQEPGENEQRQRPEQDSPGPQGQCE